MKKIALILSILICSMVFSQNRKDDGIRDIELNKPAAIADRAGGTHNASNLGLFFENRGKLYPRRLSQGPSLEFPINSGKHYCYRINPLVGIPKNVIQGRFTTNEEWEAAAGYTNREVAKIAFSDNPKSWPLTGWPVKDNTGTAIFKSDQDSYCVYNDSTNSLGPLGIQIAQTGYAYGVGFAKNLLFFKFEISNKGKKDLDSLYFSMYYDIDVGNVSGGDPEYADDRYDFDKANNFIYFYDDGYSSEWPGNKTGYMGMVFLKTPQKDGKQLGITDLHYNLYDDDIDIDSVQYGIMSSSQALYNSTLGKRYFHLGNNPNIHFDDPSTIPPSGLDIVTYVSSGPYKLLRDSVLTFIIAFVGGETKNELYYYLEQSKKIMNFDFEISKPPASPKLSAFPSDGIVNLYWDDKAESSKDNFSGEYDFEGYRLYRSMDKGVNWKLIGDWDVAGNKTGNDKGLAYSYTDTALINGIEYWYAITAFDRGDSSVPSLESPKGNSTDLPNLKSAIPISKALGKEPVTSDIVEHPTGNSNYLFEVSPADNDTLGNNQYKVGFTFVTRQDKGKPLISAKVIYLDSSNAYMNKWGIEFVDPKNFFIYDYSSGDPTSQGQIAYIKDKIYPVRDPLTSRVLFNVQLTGPSEKTAPPDSLPQKGDIIGISFGNYAIRNNKDTVIYPRPVTLNKKQATSDGIIFEIKVPNQIKDLSRVAGTDYFDLNFTVFDSAKVKDETYLISIFNKGFNASGQGFISLLVKGTKGDTVKKADTVLNLSTFDFNGVRGTVKFDNTNPPGSGNIYSLTTLLPKRPNIRDTYSFKILGSKTNTKVISEQINKIKVVPNPYIVSSVYEPEFGELRREPLRQIQFINLPGECTIRIFTLDGDLVKTIYHSSAFGTANWDLRAEGGREISTGIYLYVVKTAETEFINRFAVIK